jgi:hypothetical protein
MNMFVNDLILNACVKTTEMFICEKILTTSGNKFTSESYTNEQRWTEGYAKADWGLRYRI